MSMLARDSGPVLMLWQDGPSQRSDRRGVDVGWAEKVCGEEAHANCELIPSDLLNITQICSIFCAKDGVTSRDEDHLRTRARHPTLLHWRRRRAERRWQAAGELIG